MRTWDNRTIATLGDIVNWRAECRGEGIAIRMPRPSNDREPPPPIMPVVMRRRPERTVEIPESRMPAVVMPRDETVEETPSYKTAPFDPLPSERPVQATLFPPKAPVDSLVPIQSEPVVPPSAPSPPPPDKWAQGPWKGEPDVVHWTTKNGEQGMICRSPVTGALCGYVAIFPPHPYYGRTLRQLEYLEAPGGITFAGELMPFPELYCVGFECSHCWQIMPGMNALLESLREPKTWARYAIAGAPIPPPLSKHFWDGTYWTIEMVKASVEDLARDVAAAANEHVRELLANLLVIESDEAPEDKPS